MHFKTHIHRTNTRKKANEKQYFKNVWICAFLHQIPTEQTHLFVPYLMCIYSVPVDWMLNYAKINSNSYNNIDVIHLAHECLRTIWSKDEDKIEAQTRKEMRSTSHKHTGIHIKLKTDTNIKAPPNSTRTTRKRHIFAV